MDEILSHLDIVFDNQIRMKRNREKQKRVKEKKINIFRRFLNLM